MRKNNAPVRTLFRYCCSRHRCRSRRFLSSGLCAALSYCGFPSFVVAGALVGRKLAADCLPILSMETALCGREMVRSPTAARRGEAERGRSAAGARLLPAVAEAVAVAGRCSGCCGAAFATADAELRRGRRGVTELDTGLGSVNSEMTPKRFSGGGGAALPRNSISILSEGLRVPYHEKLYQKAFEL